MSVIAIILLIAGGAAVISLGIILSWLDSNRYNAAPKQDEEKEDETPKKK